MCKKMKVVGLTGGIATGKSTVLKIFKSLGCLTISCDDIYHELLKKDRILKHRLIKTFGNGIVYRNKILTKKLYELILSNHKYLFLLEEITHPIILKEVNKRIKRYMKNTRHRLCIVDVPLLFEKNLRGMFDYVITVYCSKKVQRERLKRKKIDRKLLKILLSRQLPIEKKVKLSDFVINNNYTTHHELKKQVAKIKEILLTK